jgi:hypothetical protein
MGFSGGSDGDFARAKPLLTDICDKVDLFGPLGSGNALKLAANPRDIRTRARAPGPGSTLDWNCCVTTITVAARIASAENVTQQPIVASSKCSRCLVLPARNSHRLKQASTLLWTLWGCGRRGSVVQAQRQIHRVFAGHLRYSCAVVFDFRIDTPADAVPNTNRRAASLRHSLIRRWQLPVRIRAGILCL